MLDDVEIFNLSSWEWVFIFIFDKCVDDVDFDICNGDDMDIWYWVKFKKILGGRLSDIVYVYGVVFIKNFVFKSMFCRICNFWVVVIIFLFEYQCYLEQYFMSLQFVIE